MNLWKKSPSPARRVLRHEFVIGPQRESPMFQRKARLYYCIRCKWSFLVCERQVIVLDEHGKPMVGALGSERFETFDQGPCPGLKVLQTPTLQRLSSPPRIEEKPRSIE